MSTFVGIEAGGTKFICAHGQDSHDLSDRVRIETTTPEETMPQVIDYIRQVSNTQRVDAIGVACFGPLDLDPFSEQYGCIASSPKLAWKNFDMIGCLSEHFDVPIGLDTDVNAAALAEQRWGAGMDIDSLIYITVGTGIGVGAIVDGQIIHGAMHPEAGHVLIPRLKEDTFAGICPYHGDCLEGLASGPAIKERWQVESALHLPANHQAWQLEAKYLAYAIHNYSLCYVPKRIILGGGVMKQPELLPLIQINVIKSLADYIDHAYLKGHQYISIAGLGENAGILGAIALAEREFNV